MVCVRKTPSSEANIQSFSIELENGELNSLEVKRQKLFEYYRDKCDDSAAATNFEDFKKDWYRYKQSINDVLPKKVLEIKHCGPLKILAFSDYRVHDMDLLINLARNLKDKPDLIVYAGDDIQRFAPAPLEFIKVDCSFYGNEEYPEELEQATIFLSRHQGEMLSSSGGYGLILRLSTHLYPKISPQERLQKIVEATSRIRQMLENVKTQSQKDQITMLHNLLTNELPFLTIIETDEEIRIIDKFASTEILNFRKSQGSELTLNWDCWRLLRSQSNESVWQTEKIKEDRKYIYFYVALGQPDRNIFEELASYAKYGMAAVIGNDDDMLVRLWIRGKNVYELHNTWLRIGSFLLAGLEGSTCGEGCSGQYLEGDVKLRLELAEELLMPDEKLIVVSHAPPRGLLDRAMRFGDRTIGSLALREFMEECDKVSLIICGHVHSCGGNYEKLNKTTIANVSSHDDHFDRANIAWIHIDEDGRIDVKLKKLPSPIEQIFISENEDAWVESLQKIHLSRSEAVLFIKMWKEMGEKLLDDLSELAHLKFKYGFSWDNIFQLYMRGVKTTEQLTEIIYNEVLDHTPGIHKVHLMKAHVKRKSELNNGKIYLMNRIPLPSHNRVIVFDTEYSKVGVLYGFLDLSTDVVTNPQGPKNVGVLYGFLDLSTGEVKQFWFDEREEAQEYLIRKLDHVFIHWGGADKKILREELNCDASTLNLLYFVQTSLVAPISSAELCDVHDALCGPKRDKWWEEFFYDMDGYEKLALCGQILKNPNDKDAREKLKNANKADIISLEDILEKLKDINLQHR